MVDALPLSDLQFNLKRDPVTYKADFERYYENFQALEQSFNCAPSQHIEKLQELLLFLSQVISFYPEYVEKFCSSVTQTLLSRSFGMHPAMRSAYMKAFMRLKTKDLIKLDTAVDVAFRLHRCRDKQVRRAMRIFVVHDVRRLNRNQKSTKINSTLQTYLSKILKDNDANVAREAVFILLNLFKKNVWSDVRTANLLADACLAKRKKVYAPAVRFFLGQDKQHNENDSDSDSGDDLNKETKIKQLRLAHRVGVKTKRRQKRLERSIENVNKAEERKAKKNTESTANLVAINLLYDPQSFAERLLRKLERCTDRFEIRLLLLDLVTRLIGLHKLLVLNLYPFIQRFLRPHQREVTRLLLFAAQASHDEVPPDVMEPVLRAIADNFVTERASAEAIAVGLNATREICARCPYAISADLLSDLIQYRTYRNKNVVAAARSLIRLFRVINPSLLPRKERGRPTEAQLEILNTGVNGDVALTFGKKVAPTFVPGAEALVLASSVAAEQSTDQTTEEPVNNSDTGVESDEECTEENTEDDTTTSESEAEQGNDSEVASIEDEESLVNKLSAKFEPSDLTAKAAEIASSRIFTQEEFEAMRRYQQLKQKRFGSVSSKRKLEDQEPMLSASDEDEESQTQLGQLASMSDITRLTKRPRLTKAERLEAVREGRSGREKYGYKVNRMNPHASTTNREKSKGKAFQMIKHKVRRKAKRSFRDKQIALRDQLRHMVKHMRT